MAKHEFEIPDLRYSESERDKEKYRTFCRTEIDNSWNVGIEQQASQKFLLYNGLTWKNVGHLMGYLFGKSDKPFKRMIFENLFNQYYRLDRRVLQEKKVNVDYSIPDERSKDPVDYEEQRRFGRMKTSWNDWGIKKYTKTGVITFNEGLTWGSIGQILGYLLGNDNEGFQRALYDKMFEEYDRIIGLTEAKTKEPPVVISDQPKITTPAEKPSIVISEPPPIIIPKHTNNISEPPQRREVTVSRIIRDTIITKQLKDKYEYRCQVCGERIEISKDKFYAEGHHIRPLGREHQGLDEEGNMLILCPNHHAMFDLGIPLFLSSKEIQIGQQHRQLICQHKIDTTNMEYYNEKIVKNK